MITAFSLGNAQGGTRTRKTLRSEDFESIAKGRKATEQGASLLYVGRSYAQASRTRLTTGDTVGISAHKLRSTFHASCSTLPIPLDRDAAGGL